MKRSGDGSSTAIPTNCLATKILVTKCFGNVRRLCGLPVFYIVAASKIPRQRGKGPWMNNSPLVSMSAIACTSLIYGGIWLSAKPMPERATRR